MLVFSARNLFFILCQKLIIVGEDLRSKGNWKFNSRKGESGGKQLESRIGMNYSRYLLGSSDPIDRFLSYFKGAMRFSTKWKRYRGISRPPGISGVTTRTKTIEFEKHVRNFISSQFRTIVLSLLRNFFFWFEISCAILFFPRCEYFLWVWKRSFGENRFEVFSRK